MKKNNIIPIILLLFYSCNKSVLEGEPDRPEPFDIAFVDSETNKNLLDTSSNAYYHIDSLKFIKQNGEVVELYQDSTHNYIAGNFHYNKYGWYIELNEPNSFWEDFEDIYGKELDTTFYLYLNKNETDTINIYVNYEDKLQTINYYHHETYNIEHITFIKKLIEK